MADEFSAELLSQVGWRWTSRGVVDDGRLRHAVSLGSESETNPAESIWYDEGAQLANATERNLDLQALERPLFGDSLVTSLGSVRAVLVVNQSGTAARLAVGGAGTNEWWGPFGAAGAKIVLPAGGSLLLASPSTGWPVTSAHRQLRLAAEGGAVSYSIALVGTGNVA